MRTINATLLANQKALGGLPCFSLKFGTGSPYDASAYLLQYDYSEPGDLTIVLNNSAGTFNSLPEKLTHGAEVELKRGLTIAGTDYTEELPTCWVEEISYHYANSQSVLVVECIDWWDRLDSWSADADQSWSATSATTILEWILTQVGLTRKSGTMTSLTLDFEVKKGEPGSTILKRLIDKKSEYLYAGIDKEIKWKVLDSSEASGYTFGWNAQHPALAVQTGTTAWEVNEVEVEGQNETSGSDSDATQQSLVGQRYVLISDADLDSNDECSDRAAAELTFYEAGANEMNLACRPCHGLEQFDVIKMDDPPWGGSDHTARVISYSEHYEASARTWYQFISCGLAAEKPGGHLATGYAVTGGPGGGGGGGGGWGGWWGRWWWRYHKRHGCHFGHHLGRPFRRLLRRILALIESIESGSGDYGTVPIGGIIAWSGSIASIPANWALCNGSNGMPDLRDRFVVGAGDSYDPADTGGEASSDLAHTHSNGTLATDSDEHTHGAGTLGADSDSHSHGAGTLGADSDGHTHGTGTLAIAMEGHTHGAGSYSGDADAVNTVILYQGSGANYEVSLATHAHDISGVCDLSSHNHGISGSTASDSHDHDISGSTASDSHDHDISGSTASDSHSHDVTGSTASDSHSHDVTGTSASDSHSHDVTGSTASAGSGSQENRPPYYALAYIMRTA